MAEGKQGMPYKSFCDFFLMLSGSAFLAVLASQLLFPRTTDANSAPMKGVVKGCDIFSGEWKKDSAPAYRNSSCKFISSPQDCLTNGRPDTGYLYWRWKPYSCELPPIDTRKFLNSMRGKSIAFVGDSILRNQMESLLCILSKVEEAVLVYHDEAFQSKTWHLPSHNITLGLIWAPFLVNSTEAKSKKDLQIYLDVLDTTWTSQAQNYEYIMLSGGQWFLKETTFWENNTIVGCHYCPDKSLKELGIDYSYRRVLRLALRFLSAADHKPVVIVRTWTPSHFEYGKWYNGGICNRTMPFKEGEYNADPEDAVMRGVELEEFQEGLANGLNLKLLDTYHLSLMRPDGHPGPYRRYHPDLTKKPQEDCLHWCLPGPIDTWNELLIAILMGEEELRFSL
ncbi:protein trichome birefringence-like 26 [Zingiber officinale]|uniref:Trichome birefringence-like N-terminal domain-containing protein n=1 Tax=Zingiber officinale TaxID=94328 RepID=A0A8J5F2E6_ZINOF|nr:protein trichome birefringence-like 26 [Zingiber officinale]KAG6480627.1 hypothetical protein ZIOFF_057212 [Zingiber officinale]